MREHGFAAVSGGPFKTEREAYEDAMDHGAGDFITGYNDDGWFWAHEDDYSQLGGERMKAINPLS